VNRFRRIWLSAAVSLPLLLIALFLASVEWSAVPRDKCNWGSDQFCTDYKGLYGLMALGITIVLLIALLVINRDRSSYRS
jgi:uncharacterized membrane protein